METQKEKLHHTLPCHICKERGNTVQCCYATEKKTGKTIRAWQRSETSIPSTSSSHTPSLKSNKALGDHHLANKH